MTGRRTPKTRRGQIRLAAAVVAVIAAAGLMLGIAQSARADTTGLTPPSLGSLPPLTTPTAQAPAGSTSVNTSPPSNLIQQSPSSVWNSLEQSMSSLTSSGSSPFGQGSLAIPSLPSLPSLPDMSMPGLPSLTTPQLPSQSSQQSGLPALSAPSAPSQNWQLPALQNLSSQPLFNSSLLQQAQSDVSSAQSQFQQEVSKADSQLQTPLAQTPAPSLLNNAQLPSLSLPSLASLTTPSAESYQNIFSTLGVNLGSQGLPQASSNIWSSTLGDPSSMLNWAKSNNTGLPAAPTISSSSLPAVQMPGQFAQIGNQIKNWFHF